MAISVTGTKTVSRDVAPHLTGAALTTLMGLAVEQLTVAQLKQLNDAIGRVAKGHDPAATIGSLLN